MAFRKITARPDAPETPEKLFLEFTRRRFPTVLPHQSALIASYVERGQDQPDVALQLPTGSGKTLVGLLIAEWLLRKHRQRIVYLCPTKQLVNQVVEQANDQYGMTVLGFTGQKKNYNPAAKAEYQNAERIAVTTYSSLFNSDPFFNDPSVIVVDDAHAAENYFSSPWSVRIERSKPAHAVVHMALCNVIKGIVDAATYTRVSGGWVEGTHRTWVEKIPTPDFCEIADQIREVLDAHAEDAKVYFEWTALRPFLHACSIFLSSGEILIRPLIAPTWTHQPFANARQRIYMSATLGAGGDLERLTGRKNIVRLPMPAGFPTQGVGRRFFIFPEMAIKQSDLKKLRNGLMKEAGRSLVLVPSDIARLAIVEEIKCDLGYPLFSADDIEKSKKPFSETSPAVAVVAGRYDGIDFPGDECRLLFLEGLPKAMNLQEQFLMSRMGANALYNERILSRVLQAIGRCTRSLLDYSAIIVTGGELPDYLSNPVKRTHFSVELQAELEFGIAQSKGQTIEELLENFRIFLANGAEWEEVNNDIISKEAKCLQHEFPALPELALAAPLEIDFQTHLCNSDFDSALEVAERILGQLKAPELKGYRALWHYLAGSAAYMAARLGSVNLTPKAKGHFSEAKKAAAIPWLSRLARFEMKEDEAFKFNVPLYRQIERMEVALEGLGAMHEGKFVEKEKLILQGLNSLTPEDSSKFERAQVELGTIIGFSAGKIESSGSPDPWWLVAGHVCLVFEDHSGGKNGGCLNTDKARQGMAHPDWIRHNVAESEGCEILSVVITPATRADEGAQPILDHFSVWPLHEFISWAQTALSVVRSLRAKFVEPGDLAWRAEAMEALRAARMDATGLVNFLRERPGSKYFGKP